MDGSQSYLYTRNNIGSVTALVTPQGTVVGQYSYSPYGQMTTSGGTTSQTPLPAFGYAGMVTDQSTGLNLTLYRAYDPKLRRWLSRDPMGFAGGINEYGYVDGNPLSDVDPLGLIWKTVTIHYDWLHDFGRSFLNWLFYENARGAPPTMPFANPEEETGSTAELIQEWVPDPEDPSRNCEHKMGTKRTIHLTWGPIYYSLKGKIIYIFLPTVPDLTYKNYPSTGGSG